MKTLYQIRREFVNSNNEIQQEIVSEMTRKRDIETSFNRLARGYKNIGCFVEFVREGYFKLPVLKEEYFICRV